MPDGPTDEVEAGAADGGTVDGHRENETVDGDPDAFGSPYRLLSTAVAPRPIAWDNLAPYSFFNVVAVDPPVLMFAPVGTPEELKDTPTNVLGEFDGDAEDPTAPGSGEFVVHIVTRDLAEAMNETAATLPHGEDEFDHAGLTAVDGTVVDAPRVAEAKVAFECELYDFQRVGGSTMILGEVVHAHVDAGLLTDGKVDVEKLDVVGRLAGSWYATTEDRFSLERPP